MAMRKDGNGKRSTSYKPYDSSNSFVKKMTNTLTGLFSRRSNSQSDVPYNDLSYSSTEEDIISPVAKRMRVECEEKNTLLHFIPNSNTGEQSLCSPVQSVNDVAVAGSSNKFIISSTPAIRCSSTLKNTQSPTFVFDVKNTSNARMMQNVEEEVVPSTSTSLPQINLNQRHNITVPSISRDMPSRASNLDTTKSLSGSISSISSRRPSFNVDVFSTSNRRLSLSVCENRSRSCLSPFYSARTLYGGASALLPYGSQNACRLRSASTSKLDVFSPRKSQITMQPVPSPVQTNDQETMSAAARRILDTLEKYCSPVTEAKRIPLNEFSKKPDDDMSQRTPRATKRKLPSLNQMMPSTSDLLRLKRTERIQDSISSAKQTMSTVPENSIVGTATEDSDESSDSTELDYSAITDNTKNDRGTYLGKIRTTGKRGNKFDDRPLTPVKLPHVALKMTNLPKFNVAEFTFSKPLLPDSLDRMSSITSSPSATTPSPSTAIPIEKRSMSTSTRDHIELSSTESTIPKSVPITNTSSSPSSPSLITFRNATFPSLMKRIEESAVSTNKPSTAINTMSVKADVHTGSVFGSGATNNWTCKYDLTNNTRDKCNTCLVERETPVKPIEPPKLSTAVTTTTAVASVTANAVPFVTTTSSSITTLPSLSDWGDKFKPPTDKWTCDECWSSNKNTDTKCPACQTPRYKTQTDVASSVDATQSFTAVTCNEFKMPQFGIPVSNENIKENGEKTNTILPSLFNDVGVENLPSKEGTVSFGKTESTNFSLAKSDNSATTNSASSNVFSVKTTNDASSFGSFGVSKKDESPKLLFPAANFTPPVTQSSSNSLFAQTTPKPVDSTSEILSNNSPKFSFGSMAAAAATTATAASFQFGKSKMENTTVGNLTNETQTLSNVSASKSNNSITTTSEEKIVAKPIMTNAFSSPSSGQLNFGEKKTESTNASPATFNFGNPVAANASPSGGGFIFNGPKVENNTPSTPKFGYGLTANVATTPKSTISFGNTATTTSAPFTFSAIPSTTTATINDAVTTTNSIFSNAVGLTTEHTQLQNNSFNIFGSTKEPITQQQNLLTAPKKSGGFSFVSPSQFGAPQVNSFSSVATTVSQGTPLPNMGNSIFGNASNSTLQTTQTFGRDPTSVFNFGGGNSLSTFPSTITTGQTNAIFGSPVKRPIQETQPQQNAASNQISFTSVFGNSVSQPGSQPVKKSGGFSYPSEPNQMNASNTISFTTGADNQNNLTNNTSNSFVFGASSNPSAQPHNFNLNVPPSFNFSGGNPLPSFSAQPAAAVVPQNALPQRKIRKAVRRTAKN